MTVKTNKNCSGYDNFDGTYQYKGETSAKDTKDIKDNAGGFQSVLKIPEKNRTFLDKELLYLSESSSFFYCMIMIKLVK